MKQLTKALFATSIIATLCGAQEIQADSLSYSGDVTLTSNPILRGASVSNDRATIQGSLNISYKNSLYFGVWGSGEKNNTTEVDLSLGYKTKISNISLDFGVADYTYSRENGKYDIDTDGELYLKAGYNLFDMKLNARLYQQLLADDKETIFQAGVAKDFKIVHIGAIYGYRFKQDVADYGYYSATIGKSFNSLNSDLSFTYANKTSDGSDAVYSLNYTISF